MSSILAFDTNGSKLSEAALSHDSGKNLPPSFAEASRSLWGPKAAIAIEQYSGRPGRTCRAYASDESEPPFGVGLSILREAEGFRFLSKFMEHNPPAWWLGLQRAIAIAKLADEFAERVKAHERTG